LRQILKVASRISRPSMKCGRVASRSDGREMELARYGRKHLPVSESSGGCRVSERGTTIVLLFRLEPLGKWQHTLPDGVVSER
jgi:hypothetical protein